MTDNTELKRLAEAANAVTSDTRVEMTIASEPGPNQAEIDAVTAFMGAATPAAVLALIAESERVKARLCVCRDCGGQGEIYSGHSSYQGHNQPPEPDMDVCGTCGGDGVLGPLEDFESLAVERDQLKAENEALVSALNDILRVTPMGVEAFGIAALVLGELSASAMSKGEQS